MGVKVLLVKPGDKYGIGLNALRHRKDELIDISFFDGHFDDSTVIAGIHCIIKDNKVYRFVRSYFDYDNKDRLFIAKLDNDENETYVEEKK